MKTVAIGDVHGTRYWEEVVQQESDADTFVFVGDYFDSFDIPYREQVSNFRGIMSFKQLEEDAGKKVVTLIGNHDYHYLPYINETNTSGFQHSKAILLKELLSEYIDGLDMCYCVDGLLFSHAGVSEEFLNRHYGIGNWSAAQIQRDVTNLFNYKPQTFSFSNEAMKLSQYPDPSGNDTWQGPLWIRPRALMEANEGGNLEQQYIQIFGHTAHTEDIDVSGRYINIDSLHSYGKKQYIVVEDGKIQLKQLSL